MYILSGAVAFAKTRISNQDIISRGFTLAGSGQNAFVEARCSSLASDDYFALTGNERFSAELNSSPTALGVEAITTACEALGIAPTEIGLLIADSSTPRQTIPAESQRIAGTLGLKIPTFDILAPVLAPVLHCNLLSRWKKDRLPKYVALLYSNTPTVESSLVGNPDRFLFGDGAAALIVSGEIARGLLVEDTAVTQSSSGEGIFSVYGDTTTTSIFTTDQAALEKECTGSSQLCFSSPLESAQQLARQCSVQPVFTGGIEQSGFALSTSVAASIVEALSFGEKFKLVAYCGESIATATLRRV